MTRGFGIALGIAFATLVLAMVAPRLYNELLNSLVELFTWLRR